MTFIFLAAAGVGGRVGGGRAGPDVFVGDGVGVFCGDVDGEMGEIGGDFVGPGE